MGRTLFSWGGVFCVSQQVKLIEPYFFQMVAKN